MSVRESRLRVTVDRGGFKSGLAGMASEAKQFGRNMGRDLGAGLKAGFGSAKESIKGIAGEAKQLIKTAATLGGALSLGGAAMQALSLRKKLSDIAFQVKLATNGAVTWQSMLARIRPVAEKTGTTVNDLADAFRAIFEETGSAELAEGSLKAIGTLATASGRSVQDLANIAGALGDKFGVTWQQMPEALAAMLELSNRGGVQFEELGQIIHATGANALAAGLSGEKGFRQMFAMMNLGGDSLRNTRKALAAVDALFQTMVDPGKRKQIRRQFDIDVKDKSGAAREATKVLEDIFAKTKGKREKLALVFSGQELDLVTAMAKPFIEAFQSTEGDVKSKSKAGIDAFRQSLDAAGKTGFDFAKMQKMAAERMTDPQVRLAQAVDNVALKLTDEKFMGAIDKLAEKLPTLAEAIGKIADVAADNPEATAAAVVGSQVLPGAVAAGVGGAIASRAARKAGGKAAAGAAGGLVATALKPLAAAGALGEGMAALSAPGKTATTAAKTVGKTAAKTAGKFAAKLGLRAIPLVGTAYTTWEAAQFALEQGSEFVGKALTQDEQMRAGGESTAASVTAATASGVSRKTKLDAFKRAKAELERQRVTAPGAIETLAGLGANVASGGAIPTAGQRHDKVVDELKAAIETLTQQLQEQQRATKDDVGATKENTRATLAAARQKPKTGGDSRGAKTLGDPKPGAEPRPG